MKNRVENIFDAIEKRIDAIVLKNSTYQYFDGNFFYETGLETGIFEGSIAVLHPDGNMDLLISELEAESAKKADANLHVYTSKENRDNIFKKMSSPLKNIGVNFKAIVYSDFCKLKDMCPKSTFVDVSDGFTNVRLVKDDLEIQLIKQSCNIADAVMEKIPDLLFEGMHEYEIAAKIDYLMQKKGADKPAFDTISSFGKNTAEPHYSHGHTQLKKGDFALFDFGASFRRYNSDTTRTFVFGKASQRQKEMYKTVLEAQKIGFDIIRSGVKACDVHNAVSSYIDTTQFKGRFIHSTGHSLGMAVHDGPGFSSDSDIVLKENMVLTVEPGVYISGLGGVRIEDDILVKKDGMELLTSSSRELIEI